MCLTDAIGAHQHIVLAFITSVVPAALEAADLVIEPGDPDFPTTGLRVRSVLSLHRIVTVSTAIIRRQLGTLSPKFQSQVARGLRTLFRV